jgi:hypothetical protein
MKFKKIKIKGVVYMFTINKAEKILNIILESYPSLKDEEIIIKYDKEFSVNIGLLNNNIVTISNKMNDDIFNKNIRSYLLTKDFDTNNYMFDDLYEVFGFIHEIGHIYYKDIYSNEDIQTYYVNYKNKTYTSIKQAFKEYRSIPSEKVADEFAINIIKNNVIKIWSIMNDINEKQAEEEYNFWNMI